eukprot:CAMPEP_0168537054 /NCGR_PEP_ID=MMETSP0405-20121227/20049_1 /TAXON_ID=498012 /ORGANISM="Trichosphaerium sp, Strain Am-I-7 wt" /LENGTH=298 /DNA_ID=CAMNT_0008565443 /DNA_START=136 /DNA_END=1032 /DNA_ORIENTATION=-
MPVDLVLVRHGQSEGSLARRRSRQGDHSDWTPAFSERQTSNYRLTEIGKQQSKLAGEWIKDNIASRFDHYYCSEYARACETAALLGMEGALWVTDFLLRERDTGVLNGISPVDQQKLYGKEVQYRHSDKFYWSAPGGESIATSCIRVAQFLRKLAEMCSGFKVLLVCHRNIMLAFRILLEGVTSERYLEISENHRHKLKHGQVLHFSRRNPNTGEVGPYLNWLKSTCAHSPDSSSGWVHLQQTVFTNDELSSSVICIPRLVDNTQTELSEWHDKYGYKHLINDNGSEVKVDENVEAEA